MRRLLALAIGVLLAVLGSTALHSQTPQEIVESQRRLDQIRREQAELREEMSRIRSRVTDLSSELTNVRQQVSTSADLLTELEGQLASREEQIAETERDLEFTRARLAERRDLLDQRLREIYKRGPLQTLQVLLGAESFSDLLNRYRYLLLIARQDRKLADEVADLERQLVARERALRTNVLQLEGAQRERETEFQRLEGLRAQQGLALSNVRTREVTAADRLAQLERDELRLATLVGDLEDRRAGAGLAQPSAASSGPGPGAQYATVLSPSRRGTLTWPLDGQILYRFSGEATSTGGGRTGLGISAPAGAEVRAIAPGTVVVAGPFDRYGPTVVVSHGSGYYSLYLYLSQLRVRVGQSVESGQPIGMVGAGTATEGSHLELQIRVPGGDAVDPLPWLAPR